jgi:hypothetical protein
VIVMAVAALGTSAATAIHAQTFQPRHFSPKVLTVRQDGVTQTQFNRGERIVVLGERFPKLAPVSVLFRQGSERLLAIIRTTAIGTFRTDVHVPFDAKTGPAAIRGATFAKISALANITVLGSASRTIPTHDRDVALLGGAGILLVVLGLALTSFVRRRRRTEDIEPSRDEHDDRDANGAPAVARLREDVQFWKKG